VRLSTQIPPIQMTTTAKDAGLSRPAMTIDFGSNAPMSTTDTVSTTSSPSRTGTRNQRGMSEASGQRDHTGQVPSLRSLCRRSGFQPRGRGGPTLRGNRDRQLRQAAGDSKQHHPAHGVTDSQASIKFIRRLRKFDTGNPRRPRCCTNTRITRNMRQTPHSNYHRCDRRER